MATAFRTGAQGISMRLVKSECIRSSRLTSSHSHRR
jgi:hypothetical protein